MKIGLHPCLSRMRGQLACPVLRGARASNGPCLLNQCEHSNQRLVRHDPPNSRLRFTWRQSQLRATFAGAATPGLGAQSNYVDASDPPRRVRMEDNLLHFRFRDTTEDHVHEMNPIHLDG